MTPSPELAKMLDETPAEILVVDDTPANLKLLADILTEQGYRVRPASSGVLALRSVAAKAPDLILLDVRMPDLDGYAVCRRLKTDPDPNLRAIPVIFVSALHEVTDKVEGFAAGGVDYLAKPFDSAEVLARVQTHLELRRLQQHLERRVAARTAELAEANRALRESEERLRLVMEATRDGVWDWNLRTDQMFFNDRWYTLLDYAPGEFAANYAAWRDRVHPDDFTAAEAVVRAHLEGRLAECNLEYRMRTKGGDWKWINSRGKVIEWDKGGQPIRLVGTNVDIADRKRAEQELRLAQLSILRSADAVFWIVPDGRFINVNDQACDSLGYARAELLTMAVWDIDPDFSPERWPPHWERTRQLKKRRFETQHRRKDGTIFPVEITANYIEYDGQEYDFAFARDITERKRAETALRESEARLRAAIESVPFDFFLIGPDGRYVLQNTVSKKKWGDVVGKCPEDIARDPETLAHWNGNNRRAFAGEVVEEELHFTVGDGERYIYNVIAPIKDRDAIIGIVGLNIDITERKRAEAELERHREHLEELVAERTAKLRQAMTQLVQSEKLAALGHLVASVAHELNTPLGNARVVAGSLGEALRKFAAAVESGALRRSQVEGFLSRSREAVDLLERNAARAADLIGHFKEVAVDQTSMRRRRFLLRQTVEELLIALQPQFKRTAHRVEVDIPPDIELDSYPGPLEQVFANLVSNSLAHGFVGREAGTIRVGAVPLDPDRVQIDYADDGVGISDAALDRIFEPFFTTKLGSGGSGLGLYIVYNLVTGVLGGQIQAKSAPGRGSRFELILPAVAPGSRPQATDEVTP
ncbi:MAG: PAS domain S-box protein [Candidatus Contendobacter sp.]|nr:PAS domain S-box protein [Candidatus Contendobacter sp.]